MNPYRWRYEVCPVDKGQRPEYEHGVKNKNWEIILEAKTAEALLCQIADALNDEDYPGDCWVRITKDGKSLHA